MISRRFASGLCVVALIVSTGCVGFGGETVGLIHEELERPSELHSDAVPLVDRARDSRSDRDAIGNATFTLFAIPSGDITTEREVTETIVLHVKDAFEAAGYTVELVPEPSGDAPMAIVRIDELDFQNYNWLWPFVPTWGDVRLTVMVQGVDQGALYERSFESGGNSYCLEGECAFEAAAEEAMTEVLEQIAEASSGDDFRRAMGFE